MASGRIRKTTHEQLHATIACVPRYVAAVLCCALALAVFCVFISNLTCAVQAKAGQQANKYWHNGRQAGRQAWMHSSVKCLNLKTKRKKEVIGN